MIDSTYVKRNSFHKLLVQSEKNILNFKLSVSELLSLGLSEFVNSEREIIESIINLFKQEDNKNFFLRANVISEINSLPKEKIVLYLINRYKYEIFPDEKKLDLYPPLIQIEPTSVCNFRCIFCYQTDNSFSQKKQSHMGQMSFGLFKKIIDEIEGKVQFITLASRGEPLICKDICKMLDYANNKFLNLKINTNASMLNEEKCHAILKNKVSTMVISADAADEKNYAKFRVNGSLKKIIKNLELFNTIKSKYYSGSKIITRVSGVKFDKSQNINDMQKFWGNLVDQVAFVNYLPWENVYEADHSNIDTACSDLWRRMFVWYDGSINPCDVDYKSTLKIGNISNSSISELWRSKVYQDLRYKHINKLRASVSPCNNCSLV